MKTCHGKQGALEERVKYAAALDIETLTVVLLVQTYVSSSSSNSSSIVMRLRSSSSPDLLSLLVLCLHSSRRFPCLNHPHCKGGEVQRLISGMPGLIGGLWHEMRRQK